jgi:hypothetical protein
MRKENTRQGNKDNDKDRTQQKKSSEDTGAVNTRRRRQRQYWSYSRPQGCRQNCVPGSYCDRPPVSGEARYTHFIFSEYRAHDNVMDIHDEIIAKRIIMNFNQKGVALNKVAKSVRAMIGDGNFSAKSLIIDGYDLSQSTAEDIRELKAMALEAGLEIWFSASLADNQLQFDPNGVPFILKNIINEVSILICLRQKDDYIHLELEKDFDIFPSSDLHLKLDPETLLIVETI